MCTSIVHPARRAAIFTMIMIIISCHTPCGWNAIVLSIQTLNIRDTSHPLYTDRTITVIVTAYMTSQQPYNLL